MPPITTLQPNSLPADWKKLGAETGYHPKEAKDLRLWVAGLTGEGKSTFTRSIPDTLTLDFGDETGGVFEPRGPRINIENYKHFEDVIEKLVTDGSNGKHWMHRVVFDNVDDWANMIINVLEIEKGVEDITDFGHKGKGYSLIRNRCWGSIQRLSEAGYIWSCTANLIEKQQAMGKTTTTVIRPVVFPGFASMFGRRADYKLAIYSTPKVIKKTKKVKLPNGMEIDQTIGEETTTIYYCNCRSTNLREAKSRGVPGMQETFELPLVDGWKVFEKFYNEARDAALANGNSNASTKEN